MFYEPTEETMNLPHVVEDINGNILALTYNWAMAHQFAKYQDRFMRVSALCRPANEDDVASFMRRLGDV